MVDLNIVNQLLLTVTQRAFYLTAAEHVFFSTAVNNSPGGIICYFRKYVSIIFRKLESYHCFHNCNGIKIEINSRKMGKVTRMWMSIHTVSNSHWLEEEIRKYFSGYILSFELGSIATITILKSRLGTKRNQVDMEGHQ